MFGKTGQMVVSVTIKGSVMAQVELLKGLSLLMVPGRRAQVVFQQLRGGSGTRG